MHSCTPGQPRIARLVASADFERVLQVRRRAVTAHFALHHLTMSAVVRDKAESTRSGADLSTSRCATGASPVDDCERGRSAAATHWLGAVVPKRHARRAVTRSLLKRQIYAAGEHHRSALAAGMWIVRQRAPFDRAVFPSAASEALKRCARAELESLFGASLR